MSEWTSFADVDLSDVQEDERLTQVIPEGVHHVSSNNAEITSTTSGYKALKLVFKDTVSGAELRHQFLIHKGTANTPTTQTTVDIGRSKLKQYLECANHPTPDKPGEVKSCEGLEVKIKVGKQKNSQYHEIKYFMPVNESSNLDDSIPF